ncbi:MAG: UDPGP type 1 family protein [Anaerohalosphaeraceae bacterium]|nr:UDPGP type 1 family protein [Anaerohalosphaeraceae bacterium]
MSNKTKCEKALEVLKKHSQEHLLRFRDELNESQQENLLAQIEKIDFAQLENNIEKYVINNTPLKLPTKLSPASAYPAIANNDKLKEKYAQAQTLGEELIAAGKVAAFVVAGGQGTRLGYDGPKGDYPISPIENKTLFRLFAEYLIAAGKKYGCDLRWYIMTSELNYGQTMESFERNNYFGLDPKNVFVFQQGTEINFGADGKILLADKGKIACSPDGHGGSLKALYQSGAIADMKKNGVEYISYFQVDNPLIKIVDPLFIGLHAMDNAQMSSKTLVKCEPKEKVGNFCLVDGRVTVIEYSDLPDEYAEKRNADGVLVFTLGSIAIHLINTDFVEKLNAKGFVLPLHRAVKKITYVDSAGNKIEPTKPNGIKLETFVFDALPLAEKSIIFETLRDEEFAPVKNATGVDSAEVARQMMSERAKKWLRAGGMEISDECVIEMASSFAICAEDAVEKAKGLAEIKSGEKTYLD